MSEYRHRAPRNLQLAEEPPGLLRRILIFILLLAAAAWCVGVFAGCAAFRSKPMQAEDRRVMVLWAESAHALLCDRHPERDTAGLCVQGVDATLPGIRARWEALCLPEPPEDTKNACRWLGDDLADEEKEKGQ